MVRPIRQPRSKKRPIGLEDARNIYVARLHRDPFDRMLVCQALVHGLTILTPDPLITQYPVRTMW